MANPTRPVTDTVIDTAWGLAVADSVLRVYPNSATRDADLSGFPAAELLGQAVVLTDTGALLVYAGPVMGWRPPWGMPWGAIAAPVQSSLDVTGTASPQSVLSTKPVVNLIAGRMYRVVASLTYLAPTGGGQCIILGPPTGMFGRAPTVPNEMSLNVLHYWAQATTQNSVTMDLQMTGVALTAKGSLTVHRLGVEDIGPSANPTALVADAAGGLAVDLELLTPDYRAAWEGLEGLEPAALEDAGPGDGRE